MDCISVTLCLFEDLTTTSTLTRLMLLSCQRTLGSAKPLLLKRLNIAVNLLRAFRLANKRWPDLLCSSCRQSWICIPLTVLQPRLPNSPHATKTKSAFRHGFASGSTLSKPFAYLGSRRAACNCVGIPREAGSGSLMYHLTSFCSLLFCSLLCFSYTLFAFCLSSRLLLNLSQPANQVEGFFGKAFIDPYLAYKLGNVLVSMRTAQHFKRGCAEFMYHAFFLTRREGALLFPELYKLANYEYVIFLM